MGRRQKIAETIQHVNIFSSKCYHEENFSLDLIVRTEGLLWRGNAVEKFIYLVN